MMRSSTVVYEDSVPVVFTSPSAVLFSEQSITASSASEKSGGLGRGLGRGLGLGLQWTQWLSTLCEVREDATLVVRRLQHIETGNIGSAIGSAISSTIGSSTTSSSGKRTIVGKYDLSQISVTLMAHRLDEMNDSIGGGGGGRGEESSNPMLKDSGICLKLRNYDANSNNSSNNNDNNDSNRSNITFTQIRFIMNDATKDLFFAALREVSANHNLDNIRQSSITEHVIKSKSHKKFSPMRTSIAHAMDAFDESQRKSRIVESRGAFKYLPVLFANDMVHGSWWFVLGSVVFAASSALVLQNSFQEDIGNDDSFLSRFRYRSTWVLMIVSGIFCTLGSLAFVRAVHEDPPMKPLFNWYHFQSDELLGSWLFLFATVPVIPYCLIYLAASRCEPIYVLALFVSLFFVFGTYLFVRACYPSNEERKPLIAPLASVLCKCFCSAEWMEKHLCNDWLAGTWFIYWGTLFAFLACGLVLIVEIVEEQDLQIFILATGFFENWCFLIGSAYFVAGSYPEEIQSTHSHSSTKKQLLKSDNKDLAKPLIAESFTDDV